MSTKLRRFTISITPEMEADLDKAKHDVYYRGTQNDMIRDLIIRGLNSLNQKEKDIEKAAVS